MELLIDRPGVYTISKRDAEEILSKNYKRNRPILRSSVEKLKSDIEGGRFIQNGEPIIIHRDGTLLDGQHRLTAIAEAGIPVPITVSIVDGDKDLIFRTIDKGCSRTLAHSLSTSSEAAAIAKTMCCIETSQVPPLSAIQGRMTAKRNATHAEATDYYLSNTTDIEQAARIGKSVSRVIPASTAAYGIAYFICKRLHGFKADEFFSELKDDASSNAYASSTAKSILKQRTAGNIGKREVLGTVLMGFSAFVSETKVPKCFNKGDKYLEIAVEDYRSFYQKED